MYPSSSQGPLWTLCYTLGGSIMLIFRLIFVSSASPVTYLMHDGTNSHSKQALCSLQFDRNHSNGLGARETPSVGNAGILGFADHLHAQKPI